MKIKYQTVEFWVAIIGAFVALGIIGMDELAIHDTAAKIAGGVGVVVAFIAQVRE